MKPKTTLHVALSAAMFSMAYNLRCANVVFTGGSSREGIPITAWTSSWMTISHQIGAFLSVLSIWPLSTFFGRKPLLMTAVVAAMISGIIGTAASEATHLFIAYGLSGISSGVTYVIASLWMVENAPVKKRGQSVILINIAVCCGTAISEWTNFGISQSSTSFRIAFGVQFIFQIPTLTLLYFAPESYRWLLNHGQPDRANYILSALEQNVKTHGRTESASSTYFDKLQQHQRSCSNAPGICSCFGSRSQSGSSPSMGLLQLHPRRRLLLAVGAQLIPALCGVMTASYYLSNAVMNVKSGYSLTTRIIISFLPTFDIIFQLPPYLLISRLGVRKLLMTSLIGMALCFAVATPLAVGQAGSFDSLLNGPSDSTQEAFSAAALSIILMLYIFYNLGVSPLPWLLQAELSPSLSPAHEQDLSTAIPTLASALRHAVETGMLFANSDGINLGARFLLVWIFLNIFFAVVVWAFYPETQGRSLEEVDRYFAGAPRVLAGLDVNARKVQTLEPQQSTEAQEMYRTTSLVGPRHERFKADDHDAYGR